MKASEYLQNEGLRAEKDYQDSCINLYAGDKKVGEIHASKLTMNPTDEQLIELIKEALQSHDNG